MKNYQTEQLRNVAVVAHGGAGKTSLVEAMLYNTGAVNRLGRIEDGTTTADYHQEEVNRKITIHTSLVPCEWNNCKLNLLDTPGYSDFIGEVRGALRVVESALFVVSAVDGVEVQTEIIWELADSDMPRAVYINKMDRENASFYNVLDSLKGHFGANFITMTLPIGAESSFTGVVDILAQKAYSYGADGKAGEIPVPAELAGTVQEHREKLIEAAAEGDDELLMKYLEGEELTAEEVRAGLGKSIQSAKFVPVLCGSAARNIAVTLLMDVLADYFPAPTAADGPLSALVFKTLADPYVGKMSFLRVFSGQLKSDSTVYNSNKEKTEKIGQVFYLRGKNQMATETVPAGDIAVVVKLQETLTGDTLCEKDKPVVLEGISFPEPAFSVAIQPKSKGDEDKLSGAVARIMEEDPAIRVYKNLETKDNIMTGMGEMHLDITLEKLKRRYGVDVVMDNPRVPYRETIRAEVKVEGKHKKQTGGHGQYGHVWLRLEPLPEGPFEFTEEIFGGSVPKQYVPAVEKGVREALNEGVLAGYPVTGVRVVLYDGSYHPVDSSELAFKLATILAFKKGAQQAKPVLLEPVMNVEVTVPESYMGDVIGDFNTKRGRILGMEPEGKTTRVKAMVPLAEMYRYAIDLKSMTQGRGLFRMEFACYEEVPARLSEEIIKKAKAENTEK
ncbi:MAG: elongation factor G [Peptococcaceae bacterium]|nr:MAG: elongation factor G [Peptococcaceae bacterium]